MDGARTETVTSGTVDRAHERENLLPILDAFALFDTTTDVYRVRFDLGNGLSHIR